MQPDVLFWFYKDYDLCRDRVRILRYFNPNVRIYGLYSGPTAEIDLAEKKLGGLVDDFWAFNDNRNSFWKWKNGDLVISSWFRERGYALAWDTLFICQWDMLAAAPLKRLFCMLRPGEILLSNFRPLDEVAGQWYWTRGVDSATAAEFESFKKFLSVHCGYKNTLYACLFVVVCLPRIFLERYAEIGPPEEGFMEYKIPTLARVFGIPVCEGHPFLAGEFYKLSFRTSSEKFLNAVRREPPLSSILKELSQRDGHRLFHPVPYRMKLWMIRPCFARWLWRIIWTIEMALKVRSVPGRIRRMLFKR